MVTLTDTQFKRLRIALYELTLGIERLQKIHMRETGKDFVINGPLSSEDEMAINIILDESDPTAPIFVEISNNDFRSIEIGKRSKIHDSGTDSLTRLRITVGEIINSIIFT